MKFVDVYARAGIIHEKMNIPATVLCMCLADVGLGREDKEGSSQGQRWGLGAGRKLWP